jgi:hypothetical protein
MKQGTLLFTKQYGWMYLLLLFSKSHHLTEDKSIESMTLSNPINFSNSFFPQTLIFTLEKTTREKMIKRC